jgi:hypothetical protein
MLGHSIVSQHFMEPEASIPNSLELSICSYPEPVQSSVRNLIHVSSLGLFIQRIRPGPRLFRSFRNKFIFYGEEFLAPRPTSKLEDHPLSFVRGCLFNIFAANLHSWRPFLHPQPEDTPCCGDRDPPNMATTGMCNTILCRDLHVWQGCASLSLPDTYTSIWHLSQRNAVFQRHVIHSYHERHLRECVLMKFW